MKPPLRRLQEFRSKRDFSIAANPGFCHSLDGGIGSSTRSSPRQACVFSAVVCRFAPSCVWRIADLCRKSLIRHTQVLMSSALERILRAPGNSDAMASHLSKRSFRRIQYYSVPTEKSESMEKSSDLPCLTVVSRACSHSARRFSHGSLVGFAAARNWSLRLLRSATNWQFCVASVPAAPGSPSSIACSGSGSTGSGRGA